MTNRTQLFIKIGDSEKVIGELQADLQKGFEHKCKLEK